MRWPHVDILELRSEEPQITARVDRARLHAGRLQFLDGAVDRETLGDAVERKGARAAVEKPVAREPHFLGPLEHAPRPRIEAGMPSGAQARDVARAFLRAHRAVHPFDGPEGALDGAHSRLTGRGDAYLHQRAEQRPPAPNAD